MLIFPVCPLDEKLLPFAARSVCDSYSSRGKCGTDYNWNLKLKIHK